MDRVGSILGVSRKARQNNLIVQDLGVCYTPLPQSAAQVAGGDAMQASLFCLVNCSASIKHLEIP